MAASSSLQQLAQPPVPSPTPNRIAHARKHLQNTLSLHTLASDETRITHHLHLSQTAAAQTRSIQLCMQIDHLNTLLQLLFHRTRHTVRLLYIASQSVLSEGSLTQTLLAAGDKEALHAHLQCDQNLISSLCTLCDRLSRGLQAASLHAMGILRYAQQLRMEREEERNVLHDEITELNARKAAAWETHQAMLESLSEAGRMYARAEQIEKRARRRASLFGVFSFMEGLDLYLETRWNVTVLGGVCRFLQEIKRDVGVAGGEKLMLLEAKKKQRELNKEALREVMECERVGEVVGAEIEAVMGVLLRLELVVKEVRRVAAGVVRLGASWGGVSAEVGTESGLEMYYVQWRALGEVCLDCLKALEEEVEEGAEQSVVEVRERVERMDEEFRRELEGVQVRMKESGLAEDGSG